MKSAGGSFRTLKLSMYDDLDFQQLGKDARHLIQTLKGSGPVSGIGVYPEGVLEYRTAMTREELEAALQELETIGNPWIHRVKLGRAQVIWVTNALKHEAYVNIEKNESHLSLVLRELRSIPKCRVVGMFAHHYKLYGCDDLIALHDPGKPIPEIPPDPPPPKKDKKKNLAYEEFDMKMAEALRASIILIDPTWEERNGTRTNMEHWADTFRLIRERDKRSPQEIAFVVSNLEHADFWRNQVMSPDAMRRTTKAGAERFTLIKRDIENGTRNSKGRSGPSISQYEQLARKLGLVEGGDHHPVEALPTGEPAPPDDPGGGR